MSRRYRQQAAIPTLQSPLYHLHALIPTVLSPCSLPHAPINTPIPMLPYNHSSSCSHSHSPVPTLPSPRYHPNATILALASQCFCQNMQNHFIFTSFFLERWKKEIDKWLEIIYNNMKKCYRPDTPSCTPVPMLPSPH